MSSSPGRGGQGEQARNGPASSPVVVGSPSGKPRDRLGGEKASGSGVESGLVRERVATRARLQTKRRGRVGVSRQRAIRLCGSAGWLDSPICSRLREVRPWRSEIATQSWGITPVRSRRLPRRLNRVAKLEEAHMKIITVMKAIRIMIDRRGFSRRFDRRSQVASWGPVCITWFPR